MSIDIASLKPRSGTVWLTWSVLFLLELCLAPWTILGSGILAGRTAGWIVDRSGIEFYPSQQPNSNAGWSALLLCALGVIVLVIWHAFDFWWRASTPRSKSFLATVLLVLRDHLLLLIAVAALVLGVTFIGGIPGNGRVSGG